MKIDWAYIRKGWKSCKNSQEVLDKHQVTVSEIVDARKERFDSVKAWDLLKGAKSVTTAKGKKILKWNPGTEDKNEILKHVMGPSGNMRAPVYRINEEFIVGFNADLYNELMK